MFSGCSSITDIKALEKWDVSNYTNFGGLFEDCSSLSDIKELKNGMYRNDFNYMFKGYSSLSDIKTLE